MSYSFDDKMVLLSKLKCRINFMSSKLYPKIVKGNYELWFTVECSYDNLQYELYLEVWAKTLQLWCSITFEGDNFYVILKPFNSEKYTRYDMVPLSFDDKISWVLTNGRLEYITDFVCDAIKLFLEEK